MPGKNDGVQMMEARKDKSIAKEEFFAAMSGGVTLTLDALQSAAALSPVPYLSEAMTLAIDIWNTIQNDSKMKQMYSVEDAKLAVDNRMGKNNELPKQSPKLQHINNSELELWKNLQELHCILQKIAVFAKQIASRKFIFRFLTANADVQKVVEFRIQIKMALDLFTLKSHISLRQVTGRIETQQMQLLTALQCPTMSHMSPTTDEVATNLSSAFETNSSIPPLSSPNSCQEIKVEEPKPPFTTDPTIFSFDGATFYTGNTCVVHNTVPTGSHGNEPMLKVQQYNNFEDKHDINIAHADLKPEARTQTGHTQGQHRKSFTHTKAGIQFTSVAGDQDVSWINDQSQRWNFGNTYTSSGSRRDKITGTGSVYKDFGKRRSHGAHDIVYPSSKYQQRADSEVEGFDKAQSRMRKITDYQPKQEIMGYNWRTEEYGAPNSLKSKSFTWIDRHMCNTSKGSKREQCNMLGTRLRKRMNEANIWT
ncbi:hypothetical protein C8R42DRAFT_643917 [Lentinula raphanica]|nr:hypothetical protein C8R42DRAFT_643917 [Lentinula raphanica]